MIMLRWINKNAVKKIGDHVQWKINNSEKKWVNSKQEKERHHIILVEIVKNDMST